MSLIKVFIVLVLLLVVGNMGHALYQMMRSDGSSDRVVRALTWRVALSVGLFAFLVVASTLGLITPHGIR